MLDSYKINITNFNHESVLTLYNYAGSLLSTKWRKACNLQCVSEQPEYNRYRGILYTHVGLILYRIINTFEGDFLGNSVFTRRVLCVIQKQVYNIAWLEENVITWRVSREARGRLRFAPNTCRLPPHNTPPFHTPPSFHLIG